MQPAAGSESLVDYRNVFENIPIGLHMYHLEDRDDDTTLRLVGANPAATAITGRTPDAIVGRTLDENFPGLRNLGLPQQYADVVRSGNAVTIEEVHYTDERNNNSVFCVKAFPLPNDCVGVLFENITPRKKVEEDLKNRTAELRSLIDSMTAGFAYHKSLPGDENEPADHIILDINTAFEKIHGLNRADVIGKKATEVFPGIEKSAVDWIGTLNKVALTGESIVFEQYLETMDRWFLMSAYCPRKGYFALTFDDVTDRYKMHAALKDSEERYREMFSRMPSGVCVFSATGDGRDFIIKDINRAAEKIECVDRESIIGKYVSEVFPGVFICGFFDGLQRVWKTGQAEFFPDTLYEDNRVSGAWRENWVYKLRSGDIVAVYNDITEKKQSGENEKKNRTQLNALVDGLIDAIVVVDEKGSIRFVNNAASHLFDRKKQALIGTAFGFPVTIGDIFEITVNIPGGENRHAEVKSSVIVWDGELSYLLSLRDSTARKKAEREHATITEHMHQVEKIESIGELAGGIAHDFNNMLSVIIGYGEELYTTLHKTDPLYECAKEIVGAGRRSAELTRQLLAFSRKQTLQPEVLDLNLIIKGIENVLRRLIGEDIMLETLAEEGLSMVKVDPAQIEQVIVNLAVNARDAMPQGGQLTIQTANVSIDEYYAGVHISVKPGDYALLSVTDTGCGMDAETLSKVFEPFFTTKVKGKGTGLGLSTVYGIVKQSGGNIWVYSEPGMGTTFKIYLPTTTEALSSQKRQYDNDLLRGKEELVLVVEDEPSIRKMSKKILEKLNYSVETAANGGEALLLVEEKKLCPDLIITDVVMPEMSGKVMIDRLRKTLPDLKVIYMSGYTDHTIANHGLIEPDVPFIQKPFSKRIFGERIRAVLDDVQ